MTSVSIHTSSPILVFTQSLSADAVVPHSPQPVVETKDQYTQRAPAASPTPAADAFPEDTAVVNKPPPSPLRRNPAPSRPASPFETSLSIGRIGDFLKDICEFFFTLEPRVVLGDDLTFFLLQWEPQFTGSLAPLPPSRFMKPEIWLPVPLWMVLRSEKICHG